MNQRALDSLANREPDVILPKMLILFWVLVFLCVVVCTSFGVVYHYAIFKSASGSQAWATIGAMLFLVIIEITTVFFGLYFFDAIFDWMWFRNVKRLTLVIGMGTIVFFAIRWSISISTKGIAEVNKTHKIKQAYTDAEFVMPAEVLTIEQQIAEAEQTIASGRNSTWKGRPTREGLELQRQGIDLKKDLTRQKEKILLAALAQQDSIRSMGIHEGIYTSTLLTDYGGYAEYGKLLSLFFISLIGSIIRENKREEEKEASKKE